MEQIGEDAGDYLYMGLVSDIFGRMLISECSYNEQTKSIGLGEKRII